MAINQFGTQQRKSLFNPGMFDDPDVISQIALAENPPLPQPSPAAANAAPVTGIIPKSFTEYAADPINVAKIPEPVPAGTPMPSVVAKAVSSAIPQPSDFAPPIDSSLAGAPEAQQLFPDVTPAAGAKAPTLEDALLSGPPNAGAGVTAAASPASVQPAAPAGPLSKKDFLAQNPAKIPGAPYVPQGKKLALTGLFTAMDSIGAALDHGEASVGPGLMRNVQALHEYNQNLPVTQSQAEEAAYQNYLKDFGTARQNTLVPITTIGPDGRPITTLADPATAKALLPANARAGATLGAAEKRAKAMLDVKQLDIQIQQGKIGRLVPIVDPETQQPAYEAFNGLGQSLGVVPHSVVPGLVARTSSTIEYKEDGDGTLHVLPKSTTSTPLIPGAGAPAQRSTGTPPGRVPVQAANGGTPSAAAGPGAQPAVTQPGNTAPAVPGGAPSGQPGKVVPGFIGKTGKETGYAFDPKTQQTILTTRSEASQGGLQDFRKVSQNDIDKDRQLANRLTDVETKLNRYDEAMASNQLSEADQNRLAYLINSDKFKAHLFGAEIPVDELNNFMRQSQLGSFDNPEAGHKALAAYNNARESMSGYQRVLSGSNRGSDKTMELNMDALPKPTDPKAFIKEAINQFRENIPIMRRGLPVLPGVNSGQQGGGAQPGGPPAGAKIRDYTQLK